MNQEIIDHMSKCLLTYKLPKAYVMLHKSGNFVSSGKGQMRFSSVGAAKCSLLASCKHTLFWIVTHMQQDGKMSKYINIREFVADNAKLLRDKLLEQGIVKILEE